MDIKNNIKYKQKESEYLELPPWEKPPFLAIITFIGGYMNAYTYITRNKILANMHTANMSKLGINIALGNWPKAIHFFAPIVACILGAAFSGLIKSIIIRNKYNGDWRKIALIIESIVLFCIGFIPLSVSDYIVTNLVSFFMGYQLCLFRKCLGIAYNTTIITGNIRSVGELLYDTIDKKTADDLIKLIIFTLLTFSFAVGAIPGTIISMAISTKSVWVCSFILLSLVIWMNIYELNNSQHRKDKQ